MAAQVRAPAPATPVPIGREWNAVRTEITVRGINILQSMDCCPIPKGILGGIYRDIGGVTYRNYLLRPSVITRVVQLREATQM